MGYKARKRRERAWRKRALYAEATIDRWTGNPMSELPDSIIDVVTDSVIKDAAEIRRNINTMRNAITDALRYVGTWRGRFAVLFRGRRALSRRAPIWLAGVQEWLGLAS